VTEHIMLVAGMKTTMTGEITDFRNSLSKCPHGYQYSPTASVGRSQPERDQSVSKHMVLSLSMCHISLRVHQTRPLSICEGLFRNKNY